MVHCDVRVTVVGGSMREFRGRLAFVTGAASGIGYALCNELTTAGARVVMSDVNLERLRERADMLKGLGHEVWVEPLDVTNADAVFEVINRINDTVGEIDYLFNNAGVALHGTAQSTTLEQWNRCLDVNIRGVAHGVLAAYPRMVARGSGHIINTASLAGLAPAPFLTAYSMSKFAVRGMSESLRYEASLYGVRVSAVCPGMVETPILDNMTATSITREESRALLERERVPLYDVTRCARQILRGVSRNQALIVITPMAKLSYWLYRHLPSVHAWFTNLAVRRIHSAHREGGDIA